MAAQSQIKFVSVSRSKHTGKLAPVFDVYAPAGYVLAQCTGTPQYRSVGAAFKAARRIVAVFNETGKFPNMCVWF